MGMNLNPNLGGRIFKLPGGNTGYTPIKLPPADNKPGPITDGGKIDAIVRPNIPDNPDALKSELDEKINGKGWNG